MGWTSQDDLINDITVNGYIGRHDYNKLITPAQVAGSWSDLQMLGGYPVTTTYAGTSLTYVPTDDTSTGAIPHGGNVAAATKHFLERGRDRLRRRWCAVDLDVRRPGGLRPRSPARDVTRHRAAHRHDDRARTPASDRWPQRASASAPTSRPYTAPTCGRPQPDATFTYTDQERQHGRRPIPVTRRLQGDARSPREMPHSGNAATRYGPFLPMAAGDYGIRDFADVHPVGRHRLHRLGRPRPPPRQAAWSLPIVALGHVHRARLREPAPVAAQDPRRRATSSSCCSRRARPRTTRPSTSTSTTAGDRTWRSSRQRDGCSRDRRHDHDRRDRHDRRWCVRAARPRRTGPTRGGSATSTPAGRPSSAAPASPRSRPAPTATCRRSAGSCRAAAGGIASRGLLVHGTGTLTASGALGRNLLATLAGTGDLTATGALIVSAVATLAGTGTITTADLLAVLQATATIAGTSSATATADALGWVTRHAGGHRHHDRHPLRHGRARGRHHAVHRPVTREPRHGRLVRGRVRQQRHGHDGREGQRRGSASATRGPRSSRAPTPRPSCCASSPRRSRASSPGRARRRSRSRAWTARPTASRPPWTAPATAPP